MIAPLALVLVPLLTTGIVEDLYSHRLLFDDNGRPLVPIGMMQGATKVVVESAGGLVVTVDDARFEWPASTPLSIDHASGTPAVLSQWLVVETLEGAERSKKREAQKRYTDAGFVVRALDVGGVYGVKGTVVDIRAVQILVKQDAKVDAAKDQQARLEALGARPVPVELLDALPAASMRANGVSGGAVRVEGKGGAHVLVRQVEHSVGYVEHGFADRTLRGSVVVAPDKAGKLAVVSVVDEDAVVGGVLPSEMFASAPLEALKAQAVTARGELFSKINRRHFSDPFLVCSEQHCQVYKGVSAEDPRTNQAASETRGELAFVGGRLVESVYSACCGGHTEAADVVWDRPASSALVGRADAPPEAVAAKLPPVEASKLFAGAGHGVPSTLHTDEDIKQLLATPRDRTWCGRSTFNQKGDAYRWTKRFTRAELDAAFADLGIGEVVRVSIAERGPGGRLRALVVEGKAGTARVLRELPVRKRLKNLRSGMFVIEEDRAPDGALMGVTLRGGGFGHGSGMCQQGAIGMAEAGKTYKEILGHYYEGAEVKAVF